MKKANWDEGVKAIPLDMNDIHTLTEGALGDFVGAVTGGATDVLFDNAPPVVAVGATITVDFITQQFTIGGVLGEVPLQTVVFPISPTGQHRVFFVIGRTDITDTRDVLQEVAGTLQVVSTTVTTRIDAISRVEKTSSAHPATPAPVPSLGPNDIGYIEYCTVIWDGVSPVTNYNTADVWQFPGGTITVTPHGPTHLPGASDPIPVAALSGSPTGSDPGLMPEGSFAVLDQALQNLFISISNPTFGMVRVITGNNTPGNPKQVEMRLRATESFVTADVGGDDYLGLSFLSGPYNGTSEQAARVDHTHSPSQSPTSLVSYDLTVTDANLGQFLVIPEFTSLANITQTQVFWRPPGQALPLIECNWTESGTGSVGARAHIVGQKKIQVETGSLGFVRFNDDVKTYILGITGSVTWTASDNGKLAKSGDLVIRLVGER